MAGRLECRGPPLQMKPAENTAAVLDRLARRELIVVSGKGGVGKTVLACALAWRLARGGRRVLLLEVDPRENAHQMLGAPPSGGEILTVELGLALQNLDPRRVLDEILLERVRLGPLLRRVLASPIYHQLAEGMPGLRELAVIAQAMRATAGGRFDCVVLDAPATGHGVSLLAAPGLVSEALPSGPVGAMAAEMAALVAAPTRTGMVIVTLAEEMPVAEALDLEALLRARLERAADLLIVNGLYPPLPAGEPPGASEANGVDLELWRRRRAINERELARLAELWLGPRVELPLLACGRGRVLVEALAAALAGEGA